jgi:hypothetical protein
VPQRDQGARQGSALRAGRWPLTAVRSRPRASPGAGRLPGQPASQAGRCAGMRVVLVLSLAAIGSFVGLLITAQQPGHQPWPPPSSRAGADSRPGPRSPPTVPVRGGPSGGRRPRGHRPPGARALRSGSSLRASAFRPLSGSGRRGRSRRVHRDRSILAFLYPTPKDLNVCPVDGGSGAAGRPSVHPIPAPRTEPNGLEECRLARCPAVDL